MLQFQFRYDGSQNFPKGNRYGFFPGVSAGWTISREAFMSDINWLDNLKIRASWGQMGNDVVDAYQYMVLYGLTEMCIRDRPLKPIFFGINCISHFGVTNSLPSLYSCFFNSSGFCS